MEKEALDFIYNIECPVCGSKPTYTMTGVHSYKQHSCGHAELEKLIQQREREFLQNQHKSNTVRVRLKPRQ